MVGCDDLDDLFEGFAFEAFGGEDLADFFAFAFGVEGDLGFFFAAGAIGGLVFGAGAEEVSGGHGEAVG